MSDIYMDTTARVPTPNGHGTDITPLAGTVGTDFLTFAVGGGANVEAQSDYAADPQRPTGNLPGIARSNFNNKAIRQGTFVAHSLCLWISQQILQYVPDDGNDIAWIGEWTQALSNFMLALIPPGPNLGAYLPLAGGTMSGNIQFQSGVSTVLANNTWYYAKDTAGTNRGLIIKSNDNNVYVNDGSSVYVVVNGIPTTNNNFSWSGRDTTGTTRAIIGLLTDNAVHVGSGTAGNIYLDTTATGTVYFAGSSVYTNNVFIYWRDTGGTLRAAIGMNTSNALVIGSGVTGTTDIYGSQIVLHNNTNALGLLTVNQYTYMNGGGRAYIPGAHDPFQIYSDGGYYARIHYIVGGVRDWTAGCTNSGTYMIADESAHAVRWEIDLSGHVHAYANLYVSGAATVGGSFTMGSFVDYGAGQVNGGLTVYNSLNVASGNLTVNGGTYAYGGLAVYNSMSVQSGSFLAAGPGQVNGGLTVFNSLNMASGTMTANGQFNCNANAGVAGQFNSNTVYTNYYWSYGDAGLAGNFQCNNNINTGGLTSGYIRSWGAVDCDHVYAFNYLHADGNLDVRGKAFIISGMDCYGGANFVNGTVQTWNNIQPVDHGGQWCGTCGHNWLAVATWNILNESDAAVKSDIAPVPEGCLDLVNALQPKTFKFIYPPNASDDHGHLMADDHPLRGTHWGFIWQDVVKVMHDRERTSGLDFAGAFMDEGRVGMLAYNELYSVLWQAVRELSAKVESLEARLAA